jgi:hypothetical protein
VHSIDVADVLRQKAPKLWQRLPPFVLNRLRCLVHEEDIDRGLQRFGHTQGLDFVEAVIDYLGLRIEVWGEAHIPPDDRLIVVANHLLGGLDGLAMLALMGKWKLHLLFLVNDVLMHIPNMQSLLGVALKLTPPRFATKRPSERGELP